MPRRAKADATARAFGQAARRIRQERGETLDEVAGRISRMDSKYLGEVERGWHSVTISTAQRIAVALEVPLSALVRDL